MGKNVICSVSFRLRYLVVIAVCLVVVILGCVVCGYVTAKASGETYIYTIVIDAGHGGRDVGCSGQNSNESDINLAIAKKLKRALETGGFRVVMTRDSSDGLYESDAGNFKLSDMNKRLDIISRVRPDMLVSIHQNAFEDTTLHGAQVFYQEGDKISEAFASSMQEQLRVTLGNVRGECNSSDLYILKESGVTGVLIECGFLSNTEDERLLLSEDYQERIAYSIMCGVVRYLVTLGAKSY